LLATDPPAGILSAKLRGRRGLFEPAAGLADSKNKVRATDRVCSGPRLKGYETATALATARVSVASSPQTPGSGVGKKPLRMTPPPPLQMVNSSGA